MSDKTPQEHAQAVRDSMKPYAIVWNEAEKALSELVALAEDREFVGALNKTLNERNTELVTVLRDIASGQVWDAQKVAQDILDKFDN